MSKKPGTGLNAGYNPDKIPSAPNFRQVVRFTALIKKKPGMSDADFVQHYNTVHGPMAAPIVLRSGAISYSLTYCLERDRQILGDIFRSRDRFTDYDAIATMIFPDYKALAKFMCDKDCAKLPEDHDNFLIDAEIKVLVGDEYMLIEDGQLVNQQ